MGRGVRALLLLLLVPACAHRTEPPPRVAASGPASDDRHEPQPVEPAPPVAPEPVVPPAPEPAPAPSPSALPRVCNPPALTEVLAPFPKSLEEPELGPSTFLDLLAVPPPEGRFGDPAVNGFYGSRDFDGDGTEDRVFELVSVDYWLWLLFVERPGCIELVGTVPGYQVETSSARHAGLSDLRTLSYPLMGHVVRYRYDGSAYREQP